MPRLGIHASIARGFSGALAEGLALHAESLQIFSKTASQWVGKALDSADVAAFREYHASCNISPIAVHDSYLINLASPDKTLWEKSIRALRDELERTDLLGLDYLVVHPGAHVGTGEEEGLKRIASGLNEVTKLGKPIQSRLLLETTAGQGTNLGYCFEHLKILIDASPQELKIGVCLDTCHVVAAGYPLSPAANYHATMRKFDDVVGINNLHFFHINDSMKPLASRLDRHAHLGLGHVGEAGFMELVNDPRFINHGMVLETAKGSCDGELMDLVNLRFLKKLLKLSTGLLQT